MRMVILIILFSLNYPLYGSDYSLRIASDTTFLYQQLDSLEKIIYSDETTLDYYLEISPILNKVNGEFAVTINQKILSLALKIGSDEQIAIAHLYSALNYAQSSNFKIALDHLQKSRKIIDANDNQLLKGQLELYQGLFFLNQTAYNESRTHFMLSIDYLTKYPKNRMLGANYNNIGVSFLEEDIFDSALFYFDKAFSVKAYIANELDKALVLTNIGSTKLELGNYNEALTTLFDANKNLRKFNYHSMLPLNESLIAKTYRLMKNYDSVPHHLESAMNYAKASNLPLRVQLAHEEYSNYFLAINQSDSAITHLLAFNTLKDSLNNISEYDKIQHNITHYEREVKEKELKLKEQSIQILQSDKIINQLVIGILLTVMVLFTISFLFFRNASKKKKMLAEKEKHLQEIKYTNLKFDLDNKNRELTSAALQIIKNNDFISLVKGQLDNLSNSIDPKSLTEFNKIRKSIDTSFDSKKNWEEFTIIFEQVHQGFYTALKSQCPNISPAELKLAALLKLNFSSKEISNILSISSESVRTARSRLRKKLGLSRESNLVDYMISIN